MTNHGALGGSGMPEVWKRDRVCSTSNLVARRGMQELVSIVVLCKC